MPDEWDVVVRRAGIVEVIEARIAIEVEAAALAAERRTPAELRAMRRALADRLAKRSTVEEHVDADWVFHRRVVEAAHNPILTELFDGFVPRNRQAMIEMLRIHGSYGGEADQELHARIVDLVAAGDGRAAAELSRDHLMAMKQLLG
ncbi:FadR/GntR family transcriptional regulator [Actinoplanes sp. CA-142083]|uniref:FadR/GntR family transcriptional regulator n=1 Tax=Actinoplanes sp. CA-142083 TaxID=3239903 RepID=UPI003D93D8CA